MDCDEPPSPSPFPHSSSLLKDISNFTTPRRPPFSLTAQSPSTQFFTASKHASFLRRPNKSTAAKKLKAFQLEQSQSSRKAQIKKEQSLKSLAKSLSVWLNFLLQNPTSCGCHFSAPADAAPSPSGKRDGAPPTSVAVDSTWRTPKRPRKTSFAKDSAPADVPDPSFSHLRDSLKDLCSFDDLKQRMRVYLSLAACKEIFQQMNRVTKTIDEGRLNMKAHCPVVTELGLKDKATRILMCYNPIWLRIGLYIIFGGDSLVLNGDVDSDQDVVFLRMVIDKLFFSHEGLAKAYAYNKMVEGVYRSGYYENLGNVILKRILLLVLVLDKAKCQSYLPLEYGIDGLDGGSPLLFKPESRIKSSSQLIHEFLSSDVMHGEGNLLTHLVILGYKLSHQQEPLVEYDFRVRDLFVDLQDGLKLCRAIQLLQQNSSILMKIVVPPDTSKKKLANCALALKYIRQAGGSLLDEDGITIVADDIVNGDKELTLSLLWNMFVHLQLPLLVDKTSLVGEISKIRGFGTDLINNANSSSLELLLNWIQAVCDSYDCTIDDFHSLVDGKAIWCLLDYYFQKELHNSCSLKEVNKKSGKASIMSVNEYSDALYNFILSQKLTTLLGNFPEVLQISELLQYNGACSDRSVVILLVFLASQLFVKKNVDHLNFHKLLGYDCQSPNRRHLRMVRCLSNFESVQKTDAFDVHGNGDAARKFKAIQAWWEDMAERNRINKPAVSSLQISRTTECSTNIRRENAARTIQLHLRGLVVRRKFLKMVNAVALLQTVFRAWLKVKQEPVCMILSSVRVCDSSCEILKQSETYKRYAMLFIHRHSFLRLKRSAQLIQQAVRSWLCRRHQQECSIGPTHNLMISDMVVAAVTVQKFVRRWMAQSRYIHQLEQKEKALNFSQQKVTFDLQTNAAITIQFAWKKFICCKSTRKQHFFATKIQQNFHRWLLRKRFLNQIQAVIKIQSYFRMWRCVNAFQHFKIEFKAAVVIQSFFRGWFAQKDACARRNHIVEIQKHCRGWLVKRDFLFQRDAVIKIQCVIRSLKCQKALNCQKDAALEIQRFIRGHLSRNQLLGSASKSRRAIPASHISRSFGLCSFQLELFLFSVVKLQRWWKGFLLLKLMNKSAIIIQSCIRGWIVRRKATVYRHHLVIQENAALVIQRYIRGNLTRNRILGGTSNVSAVIPAGCISRPVGCRSFRLELFLLSVVKLQRWWKGLLLKKLMTKSAIVIQSCTRGWIARRKATIQRHRITVIQSHWKGYLARKESKEQLLDLRVRMQKSARNVDDSKRLINRLLAALSELLNMKSLSNILHTCSTLDMATGHSQKCCEELVAAGAIDTLLRLIQTVSRSIPDQEVLKHALSTLRNLARYPHLLQVLIQTRGSVQIIVLELLRNKNEGYFVVSELLKKICSTRIGVETIFKSPALLKRLHGLVEKRDPRAPSLAIKENRDPRTTSRVIKENRERRSKEAAEILKLLTSA
ncbi:abnormal spindle-like microcephaly-associated protein homolog isoform X2 [Cajanus cajan]|uniref:abnormal spindle-like microcephaly-associated protein homolog isoform X2 n=1 Tax=Cajanus cajan TaxID=3821 RepID=UPI00098D7F42|nr:abnormal spindle-like microcephaly-associated protein homolog isoform X2 [Cajanus cajan]